MSTCRRDVVLFILIISKSTSHLRTDLVWRQIPLVKIRAAINQFPRRLKACIAARGGYFEHRF